MSSMTRLTGLIVVPLAAVSAIASPDRVKGSPRTHGRPPNRERGQKVGDKKPKSGYQPT